MWRERKEAKGLLAWPKVTRPKELGGLEIADLKNLSRALRVRWLWLKKTDPSKPWAALPIQANEGVQAFFLNGSCYRGERWSQHLDTWPAHRGPIANKRTIFEALTCMVWLREIHGVVSIEVIIEILRIGNLVS